ncbi:bifunctional diguanylate cyclase/phosphodiesterase [Salinivibrio sp. ES.052]|uniref:putative bifunctional diguanylate cyclase/phosphodiesterase n=1 Tax=Salinivibrio sp. ES.052 TaxID=1882823 RepID=UPI000929AD8E|nr:EAL domain-containing protein [Salinivibrio sp. ES.052]SIO34865.1 diguanylate cyclase (GGDEF) domain-containing protein [Salinivibrio sp. ES.052]
MIKSPSQATILIIDDRSENIDLLSAMLDQAGYQNVIGLIDPYLVDDHLSPVPDLILLDMRMPRRSGLMVLDDLNQALGEHCPPVMVLTADNDVGLRNQALCRGAIDYISKPFDYDEVLQRIHNLLQLQLKTLKERDQAARLQMLVNKQTAALRALSLTHPLTGLPNRRALLDAAERQLMRGPVTVLMIALDGMEAVTQHQGHLMTEALYKHIAELLANSTVARPYRIGVWDSSRLVMLMEEDGEEASQKAARINRLISGHHTLEGRLMFLHCHIGISRAYSESDDVAQLFRQAILAIPTNGQPIGEYQPELDSKAQREHVIRTDLGPALQSNHLSLVYQPKWQLDGGQLVGAEALLRWQHPTLGAISPAEFIPIAERSADMIQLGDKVLMMALEAVAQWRMRGLIDDGFHLSVNVSAQQLRHGFAETVLARCHATATPPSTLQLEVTESALIQQISVALNELQQLRDAGMHIALDDFGTGYSSLSYLKQLPVDWVKLDRSFIQDLATNASDKHLVGSVIALAHGFGHGVVAEGVEKVSQQHVLQTIGCDQVQGFLYAKPLVSERFDQLLQTEGECRATAISPPASG